MILVRLLPYGTDYYVRTMSNVIEFPTKPKVSANDSVGLSEEKIAELLVEIHKRELSDKFAEKNWERIIKQFSAADIDIISYDEFFPSAVLILESIRSLHLRTQGIYHPLQDFADNSIEVENNGD